MSDTILANDHKFYIDGKWVTPHGTGTCAVVNPADGRAFTTIAMGDKQDVDDAVAAARRAFPAFAATSREERMALLERILEIYKRREPEIAEIMTREMGAPVSIALSDQTAAGTAHLEAMIDALRDFTFEEMQGTTLIRREPIGVAVLITPWNWPINQIACKVAPAIAAGCTMVLKPSEVAPLNAILFAEVMAEAGVPAGVFNMIQGDGPTVGEALSSHPAVDMVSLTGSTRAGAAVSKAAADTVKRVHQELGGKSANILLDDVDLDAAVTQGVKSCMLNTGQSCDAPTRMLVPAALYDEAVEVARKAADGLTVGDPTDPSTDLGPLVSDVQYGRVTAIMQRAVDAGARVVTGGIDKPAGLEDGYYVRPTVLADVTPDMEIAREEVFGPVLVMMPYDSEEDAVALANDTVYGLAAYVQGKDRARLLAIARRLIAGNVHLNYPDFDAAAPFGGYKQSGNGREYGRYGLADYLEYKAVIGAG